MIHTRVHVSRYPVKHLFIVQASCFVDGKPDIFVRLFGEGIFSIRYMASGVHVEKVDK